MKKLLIASSLILSGSVMASGFYVGGQVGGVAHTFSTNEVDWVDPAVTNPPTQTPGKTNSGANGFVFGGYGGYKFDFDQFFVAAEIDANIDTSKAKYTSLRNTLGRFIDTQHTMGIYALTGLSLSDKVDVYARLGVAQTSLEYKYSEGDVNNGGFKDKKDHDVLATVVGLGMKYHLSDMLALRADYRFSMYEEFKATENSGTIANNNTIGKNEVDLSSQTFNIGVEYSF